MKRNIYSLMMLGLIMILSNQLAAMQCTIKGAVVNRNSKALLIRKYSESARTFLEKPTLIEIKDGKFSYTFSYTEAEAFELVFEDELKAGAWTPILFFPTDGIIELKLYPQQEWEQNKVIGGKLNVEYSNFCMTYQGKFEKPMNDLIAIQYKLDSLDEFESPEYKEVLRQLRVTKGEDALAPIYIKRDEMEKTHACYTVKAKELFVDPFDSLKKAAYRWRYEYVKNSGSLVSYYLLFEDVEMEAKENAYVAQLATEVFPAFEKQFPKHIYTERIGNQLAGLQSIVPGRKYIDVDAPAVEGCMLKLSEFDLK